VRLSSPCRPRRADYRRREPWSQRGSDLGSPSRLSQRKG